MSRLRGKNLGNRRSYTVCRVGRAIDETEKQNGSLKTILKLDDVTVCRFEVYEMCNRIVGVAINSFLL